MFEYDSSNSKMSFQRDDSSDNDSDYYDRDPGREVIEKNIRNRLQRVAGHTKDELNKVLKRVDTTLHNYDSSVQSSLIQHGMSTDNMSNIEHVADIKELEDLLNDSMAKQRYKQRLMIFIVGQTEQVSEKSKLLQQIGQFFHEQKQSFSASEFNDHDPINEKSDEIDVALKSFDVKDCYVHVKTLGTRLNELNEDIIQYLIQTAGSKQQAKAKKKLALAAKETRDQLNSLQSQIEMANTEMIERDNKIEILEKEIDTLRSQTKTYQYQLQQYEKEIGFCKNTINELEDNIGQYKIQIDDLTKNISTTEQVVTEDTADTKTENEIETEQKSNEIIVQNQIDAEEVQLPTTPNAIPSIEKIDKEVQTTDPINENSEQILSETTEDLKEVLNTTDEIESNNITTTRIKELELKESLNNSIIQSLQQQFHEFKGACEIEQNELINQAENAYQLQIKAQKAAEEAINHLRSYMVEQEKLLVVKEEKPELVHHETQTEQEEISQHKISFQDEPEIIESINPSPEPEYVSPITELSNNRLPIQPKITTDDVDSIEQFRRESLQDKYITLIEEKKQELDQLKQQADIILSRPTSIRPRVSLQSLENSTILLKQRPSFFLMDESEYRENQAIIKHDQEQQTSPITSQRSSIQKETILPSDQSNLPFFSLYEMIYKFRHSIINLLEQNKLLSLANCLHLIKQLSSDDNNLTNDFIENAERVLKDILKVLQTCMATLQSTIHEYQLKEKAMFDQSELIVDTSLIDNQQSTILEQKESILIDLKTKYEQLTKYLNQTNTKHEEESNENQRLIHDQQKVIQSLQQDLTRLQKRLIKIETEGIVEPSIMFTRLDAERNEQTLQQAVHTGKVSETTYDELNEVMTDYVSLPAQQLSNLVKRYIQFRRATELEDRIQSGAIDNDTKTVLKKMESLHERRSDQMGERMANIRQQRANLARVLTEKFDQLEGESSIFLIRPVFSYQGRAAAQSYMQHEKRRRDVYLQQNLAKRKHNPSRQSVKSKTVSNQPMPAPVSSMNASDDEERLFRIEKSIPSSRSPPNGQHINTDHTKQTTIKFGELTRLEELDIQRTLMPTSQATIPLLSAFSNNTVDPCVPSLNLRSYVALSRPTVGNLRMEKSHEISSPILRERFSITPAKTSTTNPRTSHNSSAGGLKRTHPSLPPIKRSLNPSVTAVINERQHIGFVPPNSTNEISTMD